MPNNELKALFSHYPPVLLRRFKIYHSQNPHIYEEFEKLAFEMKATGRRKYSSKMIINVLRWRMDLKTIHTDFKISDCFQSIYGRLFVYNNPDFIDFFEFRVRSKK